MLTRLSLYVGTALPSFTPVGASRASPAGNDLSAEEIVVAYHERTKHHYHRFAASVGYMDWATQPDPSVATRQKNGSTKRRGLFAPTPRAETCTRRRER